MNMKKCLVTGSGGFIGTYLVKELKNQGFKVVEFNRSNKLDVTSKENFSNLEKVDVVFHLAAVSGYKNSNANANLVYKTNYLGVVNVLEYCRRVKAKLVFPSTYVYDKPYNQAKKETDKANPTTNYSFTKFLGESLCLFYSRVFKVNTLILRTSNVYGPGQNPIYLIPVIRDHLLKSKALELTRPEVERSFIYIDDLVSAYIKLALSKTTRGDVFNVGPDQSTSLKDLVSLVGDIYGKPPKISYSGKDRPNEVDINRIDNHKIKSFIDWQPVTSLKSGLIRTLCV
jgi:GDP-4-dehydro-6-deoxy-D-mannose reductase